MDETRKRFEEFCAEKGLEPSDRDYFFWVSALQTTREQIPVAYGYFGAGGEVLQLLDFIQPDRRPKPVPLYESPVANVPRPDIPAATLKSVWQTYFAEDGDLIGFANFIQNYMRR